MYTQLLNRRAGIEADCTVTRLGDTRFRIVTSTASGGRDAAWLRRHAPAGVSVEDVTGGVRLPVPVGAGGPGHPARHWPTTSSTSRFLRARFTVGPVPVLAQRVTFVGELGWELYTPTEYTADAVGHAAWPPARRLGLRPAGYRAIDAMRLEKGYRVWGRDITPETTPDEAGLGFAVRADKDFLGGDALLAARRTGPVPGGCAACGWPTRPRCASARSRSGSAAGPCGRVTSGGFGYRIGASIAYAYLPSTAETGTPVEVGVFGVRCPATVRAEPLFDPGNVRVRG